MITGIITKKVDITIITTIVKVTMKNCILKNHKMRKESSIKFITFLPGDNKYLLLIRYIFGDDGTIDKNRCVHIMSRIN
jgi:hypothetical protein